MLLQLPHRHTACGRMGAAQQKAAAHAGGRHSSSHCWLRCTACTLGYCVVASISEAAAGPCCSHLMLLGVQLPFDHARPLRICLPGQRLFQHLDLQVPGGDHVVRRR